MNYETIQRLWREQGLRVLQRRRRNAMVSADTPDRVSAVDFQFEATTDEWPDDGGAKSLDETRSSFWPETAAREP